MPSGTPRPTRRVVALLTLVATLAALLVGAAPADARTSAEIEAERDFVALANVERAKHGVGALTVQSDIVRVARRHSERMAADRNLHHNPNFSTEITGWQRLSENVGRGPTVGAIHRALMDSDGHRRNILDDRVTEIGVGVVIRDGQVWVTQNFRRPSGSVTVSAPSTTVFGDVSSRNLHVASIESAVDRGIAEPCGIARFCPTAPVTRGQFAGMLVRVMGLDPVEGRTFRDVSGEDAGAIEALAQSDLTAGCGDERFCPDERLTREQLATFLARALELAPTASPFSDVSRTHDGSVGALHREGLIQGCGADRFCPRDRLTRAQTSTILTSRLSR